MLAAPPSSGAAGKKKVFEVVDLAVLLPSPVAMLQFIGVHSGLACGVSMKRAMLRLGLLTTLMGVASPP